MTAWTDEELTRIGTADELDIASRRPDGSTSRPTTIWVVRVGDELYVRSYRGRTGGWFSRALRSHQGHVHAGGVDGDVQFVEPDAGVRADVDQAYRSKYARYGATYVDAMVSDAAAAATFHMRQRSSDDNQVLSRERGAAEGS